MSAMSPMSPTMSTAESEFCDLGCGYLAPRDTVLYNNKRVMVETLEGFNLLPGRFDDWFLSCCQCGNWELNLLKEHPSAQDSHVKRKVVGYNCCEHCERPDENRCELCFSITKYLEANCWRSGEPVPGGVKWRHERARMERKEHGHGHGRGSSHSSLHSRSHPGSESWRSRGLGPMTAAGITMMPPKLAASELSIEDPTGTLLTAMGFARSGKEENGLDSWLGEKSATGENRMPSGRYL